MSGKQCKQKAVVNTSLCHKLTSWLSKEKHTLAQSPSFPNQFTFSQARFTVWTGHNTKISFPLFLSPMAPFLSVSHHTIFHATSLPHSLLALNDTVYTHPASIIPFHTSPGLFICLGCWGDMKALFLFLSLIPLCLPSLSSFLQPLLAACGH